jgi:hypothetical protein
MEKLANAIGQAVFIRTDTLDYAEESIPFHTIEEMVRLCTESLPNLTLDKVIFHSAINAEPCSVTLGFLAATKGRRPAALAIQPQPVGE